MTRNEFEEIIQEYEGIICGGKEKTELHYFCPIKIIEDGNGGIFVTQPQAKFVRFYHSGILEWGYVGNLGKKKWNPTKEDVFKAIEELGIKKNED